MSAPATWADFLAETATERVWAVEQVFDTGAGLETRRWSTHHWVTPHTDPTLPDVEYEPRIKAVPTLSQSLVSGRRLRGRSTPDYGEVRAINADQGLTGVGDPVDQDLSLLVGGRSLPYSEWRVAARGRCKAWRGQGAGREMVLTWRGPEERLDVPVQASVYQGFGTALRFDSSTERVDFVHDDSFHPGTDFLVEARIRIASGGIGTTRAVASKGAVSGGEWQVILLSTGVLQWRISNAAGTFANLNGSTVLDEEVWYRVSAGVLAGQRVLYLDGVEDATPVDDGSTWKTAANAITLGNDPPEIRPWLGDIDDVRVWSSSGRTAAEIAATHGRPLDPDDTAGLVLYVPADEGDGGSTWDHVAGHEGVIDGATWISTYTGARELAGVAKPISEGPVPHRDTVALEPALRIRAVSDGPVQAIDAVYEGGRKMSPKVALSTGDDVTLEAARGLIICATGDLDPRSLAIGQLIVLGGTSSNDGTLTVAPMPASIGSLGVPGGAPSSVAIAVEETLVDEEVKGSTVTVDSVDPYEGESTDVSFGATSIVTGGAQNFGTIVSGQRVVVITDSGVNDGTYTAASDATSTTITTVETLTVEGSGQNVRIVALAGTWEYEPDASTGTFRLYASTDRRITAAVRGNTTGGYESTLAGLVEKLALQVLDPADIDSAAMSALESARPGSYFYSTDAGENPQVSEVIDQLVQGAHGVWGFGLDDGLLEAFIIPDPATSRAPSSDLELTGDDLFAFEGVEDLEPTDGVIVRYRHNPATLSEGDLVGIVEDDETLAGQQLRALLGEEWQTVEEGDTSGAVVEELNCYVVEEGQARAIAQHVLALNGQARGYYRAVAAYPAIGLDLRSGRVMVTWAKHPETAAGKWFRPVAKGLAGRNKVELTLWG